MNPGLLKIRHSHRFVAVVIQFLIPFVIIRRVRFLSILKHTKYTLARFHLDGTIARYQRRFDKVLLV